MNAEEILSRTFAEHETLAPDPETVLAGIHDRLPRRRRTLALLGTAGAVAAIAIGAAGVAGDNPPAPTATTPTAAAPRPITGPDTIALTPTWLPAGPRHDVLVGTSLGHQYRTIGVTAADGTLTRLELSEGPGTTLAVPQDGTARDVTVAGRPGRIVAGTAEATVAFRIRSGRVAVVHVTGKDGPGPVAIRVAAGLRVDRPERIDTSFTVGYVPPGLTVRSVYLVSGDTGPARTSWHLTVPGAAEPEIGIDQSFGTWRDEDPEVRQASTDGRPVLGRPVHVSVIADGGHRLWIDEVRPGTSIEMTGAANVPLAQLNQIAGGIRWTG